MFFVLLCLSSSLIRFEAAKFSYLPFTICFDC